MRRDFIGIHLDQRDEVLVGNRAVIAFQEIVDYRSAATGDRQRLKRFNQLLLANGIFRGDTKFYVSLAHTQTDIDRTIEVFSAVIEQLS